MTHTRSRLFGRYIVRASSTSTASLSHMADTTELSVSRGRSQGNTTEDPVRRSDCKNNDDVGRAQEGRGAEVKGEDVEWLLGRNGERYSDFKGGEG